MVGIEAPPHVGVLDNRGDRVGRLLVEAEQSPHDRHCHQLADRARFEAGAGQVEDGCREPDQRVGGGGRPVGNPEAQVRQGIRAGIGLATSGIAEEHRFEEGGEGDEIGRHDDDIPGFQGAVGREHVEDGVTQDLHLPPGAVTDVDLDRPVSFGGAMDRSDALAGKGVGTDVVLEPPEQGGGRGSRCADGWFARVAAARQDQLEFAALLRPGTQQRMPRQMRGGIGPPTRSGTDPGPSGKDRRVPPQDGRGMQQVQVHIALGGQRIERLDIHRVHRREPVHEDPLRQVQVERTAPDRLQGRRDQFGQARRPYPRPDQAPQPCLPDVRLGKGRSIGSYIVPLHPGPDHLGPAPGIAREQP